MSFNEADISAAIVEGYHGKLLDRLHSDVVIVGAGPSGLVASMLLAEWGHKVTLIEKRLTPGGGIWGGAMAMNEIVIQTEALPVIEPLQVRHNALGSDLYRLDAVELASALVFNAVRGGAVVLNMTEVEDVCVHDGRVSGVVINRTSVSAPLPIDPLTMRSKVVVDSTGHDAALVEMLTRRRLIQPDLTAGEGPMNAEQGERFVVERTGEVHPGLFVCGMAVSATWNGPRMGPIFGGMLLSGQRVAKLIDQELDKS